MKSAIKQLFLVPPLAMIIVMVIALIRPATIFGGIHYGGILGIFIPVIVIMIGVIIWFYISQLDFPDTYDRDGILDIVFFIVTMVSYAVAIALIATCLATIPGRTIYISNTKELNTINNIPNGKSAYYCLENDIEIGRVYLGDEFYGTFDGDGHVIKNRTGSYLGFVRKNSGTIKNITFESNIFKVSSDSIAAFGVVANENSGEIINCSVKNCYIEWDIFCKWSSLIKLKSIGGIVGINNGGTISKCEVYNDLQNSEYEYTINCAGTFADDFDSFGWNVGGIVGVCNGGIISDCLIWNGNIKTFATKQYLYNSKSNQYLGGLAGRTRNNAIITNCLVSAKCECSTEYYNNSALSNMTRGAMIGILDQGELVDCFYVAGDCQAIGNKKDFTAGITQLNNLNISVSQLSESFNCWKDSEIGYPTPYVVIDNNHTSSMVGIWIVLGLIGAVFIGVGIYNYIFIAFKKR